MLSFSGGFPGYDICIAYCCISYEVTIMNLAYLQFVAKLLVVLSGDVQTNPGPGSCKELTVCHANIQSLSRAKLNAIQESLAHNFDMITLSETHLHPGVTNDVFHLEGYHDIIRKDRDGQGGGVAVFIKDSISFKRLFKYEKD